MIVGGLVLYYSCINRFSDFPFQVLVPVCHRPRGGAPPHRPPALPPADARVGHVAVGAQPDNRAALKDRDPAQGLPAPPLPSVVALFHNAEHENEGIVGVRRSHPGGLDEACMDADTFLPTLGRFDPHFLRAPLLGCRSRGC